MWRRDDGTGEQKADDARLMAVQCVRLRRFIAATAAAAAAMTHVAARGAFWRWQQGVFQQE